jgi:hypothetical protein
MVDPPWPSGNRPFSARHGRLPPPPAFLVSHILRRND